MTEELRPMIERAIQWGRHHTSPQTGYIHHCYHKHENEPDVTIPTLENILFALALFRSRTAQNIAEAQQLLGNLLHFQAESGNFPIYLHQYPNCQDRFLAAHLLPPLFWIQKHFHHILEKELKQKLDEAYERLLQYCLQSQAEKTAPPHIAIKIAAASNDEIQLAQLHSSDWWTSSTNLGHILVALQMKYTCIAESPWCDFWQYLGNTWHRGSASYIGPAQAEFQYQCQPEPTLYDCFLGYFSGNFPKRVLLDHPVQLHAALIQPCSDPLPIPIPSFQHLGWEIHQSEAGACTFAKYLSEPDLAGEKGFHPYRMVWGSAEHANTFVCQAPHRKLLEIDASTLYFELPEEVKEREVAFYLNFQNQAQITVQGQSANTFQLGDTVSVQTPEKKFSLTFQLEEGTGSFMGHIMRGNRPSQVFLKGDHRFDAYDWQIFLRTLDREPNVRICVTLAEGE